MSNPFDSDPFQHYLNREMLRRAQQEAEQARIAQQQYDQMMQRHYHEAALRAQYRAAREAQAKPAEPSDIAKEAAKGVVLDGTCSEVKTEAANLPARRP